MRAIPKTAKIHPAAKKCCGWEESAIWSLACCLKMVHSLDTNSLIQYSKETPFSSCRLLILK